LIGSQDTPNYAPEPRRHPIADARNQARQHTDSWEEDVSFNQPGGGQVEEDAGAFITQPRTRVEPADEPEVLRRISKVAIAIELLDFTGMGIGRGFALPIAGQHADVSDRQLLGQMPYDDRGNIGRVGEKGAEKPNCAKLDSKPKSLVPATPAVNERQVGVIEVEVAGQLDGGGVAGVAAIAGGLVITEKLDGHRCLLRCARAGAVHPQRAHVAPPTASV
jgi:hypothetical protein